MKFDQDHAGLMFKSRVAGKETFFTPKMKES